ncbi:hypothetical protein SAZ_38170 [Streptomyces noursei ZPM]|nr:hypothetical protein SAZ_38170 [Streptomyces noursei ZPM]
MDSSTDSARSGDFSPRARMAFFDSISVWPFVLDRS